MQILVGVAGTVLLTASHGSPPDKSVSAAGYCSKSQNACSEKCNDSLFHSNVPLLVVFRKLHIHYKSFGVRGTVLLRKQMHITANTYWQAAIF